MTIPNVQFQMMQIGQARPILPATFESYGMNRRHFCHFDFTLLKKYGNSVVLHLDIPKIKIALLNLILNAIEAVPESFGEIYISTLQSGNVLCIKIKDNGIGISEENINRLFEPYFTSKPNGMGLGLTATLNILQSHKATVEVESEEGKGTTFSVYFPMV